jgi:hypothetical protein
VLMTRSGIQRSLSEILAHGSKTKVASSAYVLTPLGLPLEIVTVRILLGGGKVVREQRVVKRYKVPWILRPPHIHGRSRYDLWNSKVVARRRGMSRKRGIPIWVSETLAGIDVSLLHICGILRRDVRYNGVDCLLLNLSIMDIGLG